MSRTKATVSGRSDAELISSSRAGDSDAYAELYNRHVDGARAAARALSRSKADTDDIVAEAFSRVLNALRKGGGPDISFRPYLLTAVRNAFVDRTRRAKREEVTDEPEDIASLAALDAASSGEDRAMVAVAFASLPERWQLVLWHTEVEGMSASEVAPLVGLAPNAVAALAYRAREGLRQAYLQSHLQRDIPSECSDCALKLGAYVRDGLAARERRRVDSHLETCESCQKLLAELQEANGHLKAVLIPLLLGVPAAKYLAGLTAGKGILALVRAAPKRQQLAGGAVGAAAVAAAATLTFVAFRGPDPSTAAIERAKAAQADGGSQQASGAAVNAPVDANGNPISAAAVGPDGTDPVTGESLSANPVTGGDPGAAGDAGTGGDAGPGGDQLDDSITQNTDGTDSVGSSAGDPSTPNTSGDADPTPTATTLADSPKPEPASTPTTLPTAVPNPATATTAPSVVVPQPPPVTITVPNPSPTTGQTPATDPAVVDPPPATTQPPVEKASLTVGIQLSGSAQSGGWLQATVTVRNGSGTTGAGRSVAATAVHPVLGLKLSPGFTFVSSSTSSWRCTGTSTVVCELPALPSGFTRSAVLSFKISPTARGVLTMSGSISADGVDPYYSDEQSIVVSPEINGEQLLFANLDTGSLLAVGNSLLTCDEAQKACTDAKAGKAAQLNRQSFDMVYVNDQVNSAPEAASFNASSALLDLGQGSVTRAYLVWAADLSSASAKAPDASMKNMVRLTDPLGNVTDVIADSFSAYGDGSQYTATCDVTTQISVGGSGVYQVANVQAAVGVGSFAGWSLVVVTHNAADPLRLLAVAAPNFSVKPGVPFAAPVGLPGSGSHNATIAVVGFEGELGLAPDSVQLNGAPLTNDANPANNVFNSSVNGAVGPDVNHFGVDVDVFNTSVSNAQVEVEATSADESYRLAIVAASVDVAPALIP